MQEGEGRKWPEEAGRRSGMMSGGRDHHTLSRARQHGADGLECPCFGREWMGEWRGIGFRGCAARGTPLLHQHLTYRPNLSVNKFDRERKLSGYLGF